jgi:hypothetical protein
MPADTVSGKGGRRSGADRRSRFITPYVDYTYGGTERRSDTDRRSGTDRRSLIDRRCVQGRRFGKERREFSYTTFIPERRSSSDRRKSSRQ